MHHFQERNGELYAEGVPLSAVAERAGTPCYVYSLATLRRHFRVFDEAFESIPHLVCFSVKANSNLASAWLRIVHFTDDQHIPRSTLFFIPCGFHLGAKV